MAAFPSNTDYMEPKGSLFLRSNAPMNYSRAILNSNWHQAREAEPKDYDLSNNAVRDLCKATYHRIGDLTDGSLPKTSYQDFSAQIHLKDDSADKEARMPMSAFEKFGHSELDRETGTPSMGFASSLSKNPAENNKFRGDTTYLTDYKPPYPYTPVEESALQSSTWSEENGKQSADYAPAYKKCLSQFTDTTNYRRDGRNTWQDESGVYSNSHLKAECPAYTTKNPILRAFTQEAE